MTKRKRKSPNDRNLPAIPLAADPPLPAVTEPPPERALTPAPMMTPAVNAAYTLSHWADQGQGDIDALIVSFGLQGRALRDGDLTDAERMLMAQASTLDVIFHQLSRRAAMSVDQSLAVCDAYLRLALRAQSQCRATLEALSLVKNPQPVSIVRQANIAHGPQQVNNCPPPSPNTVGREIQPIELLECQHDVRMDTRAPEAPDRTDSGMATVGEIYGATDN